MSGLYFGELVHARRDRWARRSFRDRIYVACLDLDHLDETVRRVRLLSHDRPNLFVLRDRDHLVAEGAGLAAGARALLAARGLPSPARLELITQLAVAGYVFNPVSFFLGYDAAGGLETLILEINNTYGGRHAYALGPPDRDGDAFVCEKVFFVSPFLQGPAGYRVRLDGARPEAPRLDIRIDVHRPDGARVLATRLAGARAPLDDRGLLRAALRHPVLPLRIIGAIHAQAMRLHWARVPYRRP